METTQNTEAQPSAADVAAARWRSGDEQAAWEIWELCGGRLLRLARALTRSPITAEDAVQEAFLRAWRNIGRYDPRRPFEPWINTIVVRECRRAAAREARKAPVQAAGEDHPGGALFEAIESLPQKIKEAVALHYLIGYSIEETAQALAVPQGTVKSRLHRARQLLVSELYGGIPK